MRLPLQICLLRLPRRWGFQWRPGHCGAALWLGYVEIRFRRRYVWENGSSAPLIVREPGPWWHTDLRTRFTFSFRSWKRRMADFERENGE